MSLRSKDRRFRRPDRPQGRPAWRRSARSVPVMTAHGGSSGRWTIP